MATIQLTRTSRQANAVRGSMTIPFEPAVVVDTLENADCIIPPGTYPLQLTWSPRFKKLLPLVDQVPDREGIRIHCGTKPEHSAGCILTSIKGVSDLIAFFNRLKKFADYDDAEPEDVFITITDNTQ